MRVGERVANRGVGVDGDRLERRRVRRLEARVPELGLIGRIRDERPQAILGARDRRFRENHALLALRDFGFGLDDVERRHRADLDARAVVAERPLRELAATALHREVVDGVDQIPVGVLHVARRDGNRLLQLHVRDLAILPADQHLLPRRVDLEVAQQRLRVVERDRSS